MVLLFLAPWLAVVMRKVRNIVVSRPGPHSQALFVSEVCPVILHSAHRVYMCIYIYIYIYSKWCVFETVFHDMCVGDIFVALQSGQTSTTDMDKVVTAVACADVN